MDFEFSDFCNTSGALLLKRRIEGFWHERGFDVDVELITAGFVPAMRSGRTDLRSDMFNGLPSRKASDAVLERL